MSSQPGARGKYVGVDPGSAKCGLATMAEDGSEESVAVVPTGEVRERIEREILGGDVRAICIGHATTSAAIVEWAKAAWPDIPLFVVDETNSSMLARELYYADHPPKGLLRFVPRGLLVPKEPIDGYAALIILRRFRRSNGVKSAL
jgi:RNase H-fold protein (predicted Holliday junction resolvase)